jgi:molybdate transport system ATP-binding protein
VLTAHIRGQIGSLTIAVELDTSGGPLIVVGPNGAGKTALLLMLLGARAPRDGRITLHGEVLFDHAARIDVPIEARGIGYVPQRYGLFPNMSVAGNVEFALACQSPRLDRKKRSQRALGLLRELGVAHLAARRTHALSGGERQKVALARALGTRPHAMLLDEPLAAMDVAARREVRVFLRDYLRGLGLPTIVVSHDPADAAALGYHIAVLEHGRIVQTGSWDELRARPGSPFVEAFVETPQVTRPALER